MLFCRAKQGRGKRKKDIQMMLLLGVVIFMNPRSDQILIIHYLFPEETRQIIRLNKNAHFCENVRRDTSTPLRRGDLFP